MDIDDLDTARCPHSGRNSTLDLAKAFAHKEWIVNEHEFVQASRDFPVAPFQSLFATQLQDLAAVALDGVSDPSDAMLTTLDMVLPGRPEDIGLAMIVLGLRTYGIVAAEADRFRAVLHNPDASAEAMSEGFAWRYNIGLYRTFMAATLYALIPAPSRSALDEHLSHYFFDSAPNEYQGLGERMPDLSELPTLEARFDALVEIFGLTLDRAFEDSAAARGLTWPAVQYLGSEQLIAEVSGVAAGRFRERSFTSVLLDSAHGGRGSVFRYRPFSRWDRVKTAPTTARQVCPAAPSVPSAAAGLAAALAERRDDILAMARRYCAGPNWGFEGV